MSRPMSRTTAKRKQLGNLEALHIEGSEDGPTIVFFHGFGADMSDLASLAEFLQVPEGTNWVFPNGHLTVPLGGHFEGRAWFPISISELERSMALGQSIDWSAIVPPGLNEARTHAFDLIDALDVPADRLILGGFSQGGMLATDVTLHLKERTAGLAVLSGTLVNSEEWQKLASEKAAFPFFQSHGARDPVLSFAMAQKLEKLFLQAGWKGQLLKFDGAHEIPPVVMQQLSGYLRRRLQ